MNIHRDVPGEIVISATVLASNFSFGPGCSGLRWYPFALTSTSRISPPTELAKQPSVPTPYASKTFLTIRFALAGALPRICDESPSSGRPSKLFGIT